MFNNVYIQFVNNFNKKLELERNIKTVCYNLKNTNQIIKWLVENQETFNYRIFNSVLDALLFHKKYDCYTINKLTTYTLSINAYTYDCVLSTGINIWNPITNNLDYLTDTANEIFYINNIKELE